jgi:energy-converting hydrogenase Eha subunit A
MKINSKEYLNSFVISGFMSIISFIYMGITYRKHNRPSAIPYELFPIIIPLLYGVFGVINYYVINKYGIHYSFVVGMFLGLLLSVIARFQLNLPILLFNYTKKTEWEVHIIVPLIYGTIFSFITTPFAQYLIN